MNKTLKDYILVAVFFVLIAWTPVVYTKGNDIIILGEILIPVLLLFILITKRVSIRGEIIFFLFPFLCYLTRILVVSLHLGTVENFEILLTIKQLEFFVVFFTGYIIAQIIRNTKIAFISSATFSISYMLFVFSDALLKYGEFRRAGIPIKPGVATSISGFFALLPIYFFIHLLGKKPIYFLVIVFSFITGVLTFSRGNLFSLLLTLILIPLLFLIFKRKEKVFIYPTFALFLIISSYLIFNVLPWTYGGLTSLNPVLLIELLESDTSWAVREGIMKNTLTFFSDNSNFLNLFFGFVIPGHTAQTWDTQYMKLLSETGLVGTLVFMTPFVYLLITAMNDRRKNTKYFSVSIIMIIIHLLVMSISAELLTNVYVIMIPMYGIFGMYLGSKSFDKELFVNQSL